MSGAFETVAGAFAVVGVADVVVRTGREIYSFIRDVVDAPNHLIILRECLQDVNILARACRQCLDKVSAGAEPSIPPSLIAPLDAGLKALNRELQSLKVHLARFRGTRRTWDRVKYVLDERKIEKALSNLERSKTLLANALMVAYG